MFGRATISLGIGPHSSIDSVIHALRVYDVGCHFVDVYVDCIAYADDIILLRASLINLQKMIDICSDQGSKLDIQFNPSKSCLFKTKPGYNQLLPNQYIGDEPIFGLINLNT